MTIKHKSSDPLSKVFCDHCNFKASSIIELENHMITNHKPKLPAIERERSEYLNESLKPSMSKEVRSEDDPDLCTFFPIKGSQIVKKCCFVNGPNFTENISSYTNISICDSCIE